MLREADLDLGRFMSAWSLWTEHGRTLDGLPYDDQPAAFAQGVAVANGERAAWDREREEWQERERKRRR